MPFFVLLRIATLLFGDIGRYGAYFTYVVVCVAFSAGESDGSKLFGVALFTILECASIIIFLW